MVAGIQNLQGVHIGIHATYLDAGHPGKADVPKSKKTQKLTSSQTILGGAVRLGEYQSGKPLVCCEGIETGLAVQQATGYAAWACLSAGGLQAVQLPKGCRHLIVAADHDRGEAGLKAATKVADHYRPQGAPSRLSPPEGEKAIRRAFTQATVRTPETPELATSSPRFPVEALPKTIREYAEANAECLLHP